MADTLIYLGHHGPRKSGKKTYDVTYVFLFLILASVFLLNDRPKSVSAGYAFLPFVISAEFEIK